MAEPLAVKDRVRADLVGLLYQQVPLSSFISALVASGGIERSEFPLNADWLPGFEAQADWPLLERALRKGGIPVPPGVSERAARQR